MASEVLKDTTCVDHDVICLADRYIRLSSSAQMETAKDPRYPCVLMHLEQHTCCLLKSHLSLGFTIFLLAGRRPKWFMGTLMELRKKGAAKTHQIWARVSFRLFISMNGPGDTSVLIKATETAKDPHQH